MSSRNYIAFVNRFHKSTGAHEERNHDHEPPRSDLFLFPDESGNFNQDSSPTYPMLHSPLITPVPSLAQETDDFCILETPGSRGEVRFSVWSFRHLWLCNTKTISSKPVFLHMFQDRDQEPVVKQLTSDPVEVKDNYFSQPLEGSDSSRGAMNFPIPEVRYLIKEISVIWHLYGGKDFGSAPLTASPAKSRGWAVSVYLSTQCLNMLRGIQIIYLFFLCFAGVRLIAPPPKLQSDRPKLQQGQEVEKEGTLTSLWKSNSARQS